MHVGSCDEAQNARFACRKRSFCKVVDNIRPCSRPRCRGTAAHQGKGFGVGREVRRAAAGGGGGGGVVIRVLGCRRGLGPGPRGAPTAVRQIEGIGRFRIPDPRSRLPARKKIKGIDKSQSGGNGAIAGLTPGAVGSGYASSTHPHDVPKGKVRERRDSGRRLRHSRSQFGGSAAGQRVVQLLEVSRGGKP